MVYVGNKGNTEVIVCDEHSSPVEHEGVVTVSSCLF